MKHSFLFEEGEWEAEGYYIDENSNQYELCGEVIITHGKEKWINVTRTIINMEEPHEIKHCFEINPFFNDKEYTSWTSVNPRIGEMLGKFMVFDACIISTYRTVDDLYSGTEYVVRLDECSYECKGMSFKGDLKTASWTVKLRKRGN